MNPLQTIPNLPPAISLDGSEQVWINQAGVDRRTTVAALAAGAAQAGYLPLTGGTITGNLTILGTMTGGGHIYAPTPPPGDNSTALATTAFVDAALASALTGYLPLTGGTLTGNLAIEGTNTVTGFGFAMTPLAGDNSTKLATTAFVTAAIAAGGGGGGSGYLPLTGGTLTGPLGIHVPGSTYLSLNDAAGNLRSLIYETASVNRWAVLTDNSPESGSNAGSNFNIVRYSDAGTSLGAAININRATGNVTIPGTANLTVGGAAYATTPAPGDNSTALATTAFVDAAIAAGQPPGSNALPLMDGTAAAGVATAWSRGDHVHPSDTSRAAASALANYLPLAGGTVTGNLTVGGVTALSGVSTAPTPAAADSSTNIATTAFVKNALGTGPYLPLTGGMLTGDLHISEASPYLYLNRTVFSGGNQNVVAGQSNGVNRWGIILGNNTPETGSDIGTDFSLWSCADAGTWKTMVLGFSRSTGNATFSGTITAPGGTLTGNTYWTYAQPYLVLNKTVAGNTNYIVGQTNGNNRWTISLGDGGAESGSNAGSNFALNAYGDGGNYLGSYMTINRASGAVGFPTYAGSTLTCGPISCTNQATIGGPNASLYLNKTLNNSSMIAGSMNGTNRWALYLGDSTQETGGDAGSNFGIAGIHDSGAWNNWAFQITRSNLVAQFIYPLIVARPSVGGMYAIGGFYQGGNYYNGEIIGITVAGSQGVIGYNNAANNFFFSGSGSDRRMKSNIQDAVLDAVAMVKRIPIYACDYNAPRPSREQPVGSVDLIADGFVDLEPEHWPFSFIADEVETAMPHAVMRHEGYAVGVHPHHLVAALWKAVQQLTERLEVVEGKVAA